MKERIPYIDFAAGIMIIWMIIQHAVQTAWAIDPSNPIDKYGWNPNIWFPYLHFFMPWFFYKSGALFYKRRTQDLWDKDKHKFLRTFIIWSLIGFACYILLGIYDHTLTVKDVVKTLTIKLFLHGSIAINGPLWFLLTITGVRCVANIILPTKDDASFHTKCALCSIVGIILACVIYVIKLSYLPLWVANGMTGFVFLR